MGCVKLVEKPDAKSCLNLNLLSKVLLNLPLEDLLSTTVVDSYWFHNTQRLSLMMQLHHEDFAWIDKDVYPEWLMHVSNHSWSLAAADAKARKEESELWRCLNVSKEKDDGPIYAFTKA